MFRVSCFVFIVQCLVCTVVEYSTLPPPKDPQVAPEPVCNSKHTRLKQKVEGLGYIASPVGLWWGVLGSGASVLVQEVKGLGFMRIERGVVLGPRHASRLVRARWGKLAP